MYIERHGAPGPACTRIDFEFREFPAALISLPEIPTVCCPYDMCVGTGISAVVACCCFPSPLSPLSMQQFRLRCARPSPFVRFPLWTPHAHRHFPRGTGAGLCELHMVVDPESPPNRQHSRGQCRHRRTTSTSAPLVLSGLLAFFSQQDGSTAARPVHRVPNPGTGGRPRHGKSDAPRPRVPVAHPSLSARPLLGPSRGFPLGRGRGRAGAGGSREGQGGPYNSLPTLTARY